MLVRKSPPNQATDKFLSETQIEAVSYGEGPLLITAGAGSGKTRTLTSRLRHLIQEKRIPPHQIIAITFTNKAAREMKNRLRDLKDHHSSFIGTFHSLGARILRTEAKLAGRTSKFTIFDDADALRVVKNTLVELDLSKDKHPPASLQYGFSKIKNEFLLPEEIFSKKPLIRAFEKYEDLLKKQNAFDFDDLIVKPVEIFENNPEVLEKYQKRTRYILVDEYQDINSAQYRFIKLLSEKHQNLNVVGDDNQAIYSFRGADFRNFLNFEKDWPDAKIVTLGENYRSTQNIVTAAAAVIKNNKLQRPKNLFTKNEPGPLVKVVETLSSDDEADVVVEEVGRRGKLSKTAILYRTNAQSRALEQSLSLAEIPYEVFGGLRFYDRKEIKDLLACLRYGLNQNDIVSLERIEKTFTKKISQKIKEELPTITTQLTPIELIGFILKTADYYRYLKAKFKNPEERKENIGELISFASNFMTLDELLQKTALYEDSEKLEETKKTVKLMTIHTAKGLEFEDIFLIGCSETLLPHQKSLGSPEELEEERRLMYVAMTRAQKNLHISFYNFPSRFLYEIPPEFVEFRSTASFGGAWEEKDEDTINLL